jgi:hypothetical protein
MQQKIQNLNEVLNHKIIQEDTPLDFETKINPLFKSGWQCAGINHTTSYCQVDNKVHKTRYVGIFYKKGLGN